MPKDKEEIRFGGGVDTEGSRKQDWPVFLTPN